MHFRRRKDLANKEKRMMYGVHKSIGRQLAQNAKASFDKSTPTAMDTMRKAVEDASEKPGGLASLCRSHVTDLAKAVQVCRVCCTHMLSAWQGGRTLLHSNLIRPVV